LTAPEKARQTNHMGMSVSYQTSRAPLVIPVGDNFPQVAATEKVDKLLAQPY
jgi:hypothetical protein